MSHASSKARLILRANINSSFSASNNSGSKEIDYRTNLKKESFVMNNQLDKKSGHKYYTITVK